MLPKHRDQHEDGADEDDGEGDLRHWTGGEGFDFALGADAVFLLVPAWEGREKKEADEGKDDGNDAIDISY